MAHVLRKLEMALQFQVGHALDLEKDYLDVLRAEIPPLAYKSVEEVKVLLSKGILLNEGKRWLSLSESGELCEMVCAADCVITDRSDHNRLPLFFEYNSPLYKSRFAEPNFYKSHTGIFRTHVGAQFLSPLVTYSVNLVFKFSLEDKTFSKLRCKGLKYKLEDEIKSSTRYFADEREDGWLMLELYQITSDARTIELKIQFEGSSYIIDGSRYMNGPIIIEGIEFRPLEKVEHEVLDDKNVDMQPISDSDLGWEHKLRIDYEKIVKWLKIKNGDEWFFLTKNGKKCYILPARTALIETQWNWQHLHESRFKREAFNPTKKCFRIECKIKTRILSPQETYACYLVYKLPEDHSEFEAPLKVRDKDFYKEDWEDTNYNNEHWEKTDYRFVFLVSPPQTPVIGQKIDRNAHNHMSNRHKLKGHPLLRNDGWMEVQVWEFQTGTSREQIVMRVDLVSSINVYLKGLIVQGVEFKPISS